MTDREILAKYLEELGVEGLVRLAKECAEQKNEVLGQLCRDTIEFSDETESYDSMIKEPGSSTSFRCHCLCNVFRKLKRDHNQYKCNSCGEIYIGEK